MLMTYIAATTLDQLKRAVTHTEFDFDHTAYFEASQTSH
jgi:hypothetical protein